MELNLFYEFRKVLTQNFTKCNMNKKEENSKPIIITKFLGNQTEHIEISVCVWERERERERGRRRGRVSAGCRGLSTDSCFVLLAQQNSGRDRWTAASSDFTPAPQTFKISEKKKRIKKTENAKNGNRYSQQTAIRRSHMFFFKQNIDSIDTKQNTTKFNNTDLNIEYKTGTSNQLSLQSKSMYKTTYRTW